jgi:hypothetical protein
VGGVKVVRGVVVMAAGGVNGLLSVSRFGIELFMEGFWIMASTDLVSSGPSSSATKLWLLNELVRPVDCSGIVLSGLSFGLLLDLLNTSLNFRAGDLPRSLLILFLRGSG